MAEENLAMIEDEKFPASQNDYKRRSRGYS